MQPQRGRLSQTLLVTLITIVHLVLVRGELLFLALGSVIGRIIGATESRLRKEFPLRRSLLSRLAASSGLLTLLANVRNG